MKETEIEAKAAEPPKPSPEASSLPVVFAAIGFGVLSILFEGRLSVAWAHALAFFIPYSLCGVYIRVKRPQHRMRWAVIPYCFIASVGLYCDKQFPEHKVLTLTPIIVVFAATVVLIWARSKRSVAKSNGKR